MSTLEITPDGPIAMVTLRRGKVNAINEPMVHEMARALSALERDESIRAVILTGHGKFFSFGFDIPELFPYPRDAFAAYLTAFTDLYTTLFLFPKPVLAALNGHAVAGGCMLALACDRRLMVRTGAKIALNEIALGSSVFAGSVEMLQFCVGPRRAETILYTGALYEPGDALSMGLVDQLSAPDDLMREVRAIATALAESDPVAFRSLKALSRGPIGARMREREAASIREFVEIWYSEPTRNRLKAVEIRD